jgi:hypothetical protein
LTYYPCGGYNAVTMATTGESPQKVDGRKRNTFAKRHKGGKKGVAKPPALLVAMRKVWRQGEAEDVGEEQRHLRKLLKEDPKGYLTQMAAVEKEFRSRGKGATGGPGGDAQQSGQKDEATERVVDLIDRLLDDYQAGAGK